MMDKSVYDECKPFLIGSVPIISRAMKIMGCDFAIHKIAHPQEARFSWGRWMSGNRRLRLRQHRMGARCEAGGANVGWSYVMKSIELGKAGLIDVVSTAPIHKEAIKLAGCTAPGPYRKSIRCNQSDYGLTIFPRPQPARLLREPPWR